MTDEDLALAQEETAEETEGGEGAETELSKEERLKAALKEAILVERQELGPLRLKLTVTIPRETLDQRFNEEFQELKRDALVPGFRKGHAPLKLVEKRFASDVGDQIKTQLIANGYMAALEKADVKALGDPLFCVNVKDERVGDDRQSRAVETDKLLPLDKALDSIVLPKDGPLSFSCELELKPEFEVPQLEKIPVRRPKVKITDPDVEAEVRRLCMTRATFEPVDRGPVELNDLLYADMMLTVDGQVVATDNNMELAARDLRCKGVSLVGFGNAVAGKRVSDRVDFEAVVPDDHDDLSLRGKKARFEFTLREIKRLNVPSVDERLLNVMGCETEQELRDYLRSSLEASLEDTLRKAMMGQVADYLVANTKLDIPSGLSQRQTDRAVARRMIEMYEANVAQAEIDQAADAMRVKAQEQAVRDLKLYFILEKIAEDREIDVSEEELNSAIANIARRSNQRFDRVRDDLHKSDRLASLFLFMRDQKVLDTLLDQAEVTEVEGPETSDAT